MATCSYDTKFIVIFDSLKSKENSGLFGRVFHCWLWWNLLQRWEVCIVLKSARLACPRDSLIMHVKLFYKKIAKM